MGAQEIIQNLSEMEEQNVLELRATKISDNIIYPHLFFLKINDNKYLACDQLIGFIYGTIIPENYMTIEKTATMIEGYLKLGYKIVDIYDPKFPEKIS